MPHARADHDLFRPSLTAADDSVGFERPWNPQSLVVATFFIGILGGGALLAWNCRRLGIKGRALPTLLLSMAIVAAWYLVLGAVFHGLPPAGYRALLRMGNRVIAVVAALTFAAGQQRRYRLFQRADLPAGRGLPAIAVGALGLIGELALASFALRLFAAG